MFRRDLLQIVRPTPKSQGLEFLEGVEEDGYVLSGTTRDPVTGKTYGIRNGYLDLLGRRSGVGNVANLANLLPGAGRGYEPLWRVRSLSLLTGEAFSNDRELDVIADLVGLERGGLYLDIGCSAGLYARSFAARLGDGGAVIGIDISPSMLGEAARRAKKVNARPSFARADAGTPPFADGAFAGAVCGGTLNELSDPARVLRETRRVLAPGGRVAIMGILEAATPNGRRLQRFLRPGGLRFFEPDELVSLLDHAGFDPDPLRIHGAIFFAGATRR